MPSAPRAGTRLLSSVRQPRDGPEFRATQRGFRPLALGQTAAMEADGGSRKVRLADGEETTVHVATFDLADTRLRVVRLKPEEPLESWCERNGVRDAVSGGYSVKPEHEPLGELWVDGNARSHRPFRSPWHDRRAALAAVDGRLEMDGRDRLPLRPDGGLLQAGPLLVREGRSAIEGVEDPEGFSATADEFDEDLTASREPRLAIGTRGGELVAVAADGRAPGDAGLTLWEMADVLVSLGLERALNLDGGSAGVIIAGGRRLNTPRTDEGEDMEASSPSTTAFVLECLS